MNRGSRLDLRALPLHLLFSRWRHRSHLDDGYSILLPMPADLPFLLRYALEGLRHLDTSHCRQILVISDGWGHDSGRELRRVAESEGDSRIEFITLRAAFRILVHRLKRSGSAAATICHWAMIVEGIDAARCEYAFLHDADAFFVDVDALERQYAECRGRRMHTLGVQARWDPFFETIGYTLPGTWELMFSTQWARHHSPVALKGRWRSSPHGRYEFDTMLYPQYLDYPTGRVGVINPPPRFVHFASAIITYRAFRARSGPVVDEVFCLLTLALLEQLLPVSEPVLPSVKELARGLTDPIAPVTYDSAIALSGYSTFRRMVDDLCRAPLFQGVRAEQIRESIRPFDEHFQASVASRAEQGAAAAAIVPRRDRRDGLA